MMVAVWTEWWLRPVMSAARVGLQRAVVWNRLYRNPFSASRVNVGVWHGPPKVLVAPKPTSSSSTSRIFGAPAGALRGCGKSDFEFLARRSMVPLNAGGGRGRTVPLGAVSSGARSSAYAVVNRPEAESQPSMVPAASASTARVVRVRMEFLLSEERLLPLVTLRQNSAHAMVRNNKKPQGRHPSRTRGFLILRKSAGRPRCGQSVAGNLGRSLGPRLGRDAVMSRDVSHCARAEVVMNTFTTELATRATDRSHRDRSFVR